MIETVADDAGALLVRSGIIADEQLAIARRAQATRGGTLGEHLVLGGFVDDEELTHFFHNRLMVPRLDPNKLARIPASMIRRLPADMASEFRAVPVAIDRDQNLTVVMSDPSNNHAVDEIAFFTGCYVMRAIATQRQIAWCLAHYYGFVSALGQTLMQPTPTPSPADGVPKTAVGSVTGQVQALRHKVKPPETPEQEDVEDRSTGPMKAIKQAAARPVQPPELHERKGEVIVRGESDATPSSSREDLPRVVVDDATDPAAPIAEAAGGESEPVVILDRPRRPDPEDEEPEEVLVLDMPKAGVRDKARTRIGMGVVPEAVPRVKEDTGETNIDTGQFRKVDYEYDEDEWEGFGPPGTTIPPGFLGAMPDSDGTGPNNAIPIATDFEDSGAASGGIDITQPNPVDPVAALAHTMEDAADTQRELDQSASRLVGTLRALDRAERRDEVVDALLEHLVRSFNRCTFLVIKGEDLTTFRTKGVGPFAPSWRDARLAIAEASMFRDVVSSRMPFRGQAVDFRSKAFVSAIFGTIPDELVVVPLAVRERIVGVLLAGDRFERMFHEHLAVIARAAGEAFERILQVAKSG
jgi:hypothetical protein